ncbi:hypothetical protein AX16_005783 [Volvariella volvacea WC 439]|nr:hypothetical protein AX16_005783 [Volvariella volvacea WC 439]
MNFFSSSKPTSGSTPTSDRPTSRNRDRDDEISDSVRQRDSEGEVKRHHKDRETGRYKHDVGYPGPTSETKDQEPGYGSQGPGNAVPSSHHHHHHHSSRSSRDRAAEKENKQLRADLEQKEIELRSLRNQLQSLSDQWTSVQRSVRQREGEMRQQMDALFSQLQLEQQQHAQTKVLLDQRNNELRMVEPYISRGNNLSGKELTGMVETLNQEISQTCMTIIDALNLSERKREPYRGQSPLEGYLSPTLLSRLADHAPLSEDLDEELGIQTALQALMAGIARHCAQSWCPSDDQTSVRLQSIYKGLYASDPHTAPRWRAMTRAQLREQLHAQNLQFCKEALVSHIKLLLGVCGWSENSIAKSMSTQSQPIESGLDLITDWALRLNKAMGEDIIQDEPTILWFHPHSPYDSYQAEDAFEDPRKGPSEATSRAGGRNQVICTTELGLRLETPRTEGFDVNTVLKAKVVLSRSLERR